MPWGAVAGAAIGAAGSYMSRPDDPEAAPMTGMQNVQNLMAPHYYQRAMDMAANGFQAGPGFNQDQQNAFGMIRNTAGGSPTQTAAQNAMMRGANGNANPMFGMDNPYTTKAIDATTSDMQRQFNRTTAPMLDAMNSRANTGFGTSSAVDSMRTDAYQGLNDQMAQVSNDMRMRDLNSQQHMGEGMAQRQLQAAGMGPAMQGMQYNNANALLGAGNQQQTFDFNEFMRGQNHLAQGFGYMGSVMGQNPGQIPMQQGQGNPNYLNSAMGGAVSGMGVMNQFRSPQQNDPYAMPTTSDGNIYQPTEGFGSWWGGNGGGW